MKNNCGTCNGSSSSLLHTVEKDQNMKNNCGTCNRSSSSLLHTVLGLKHEEQLCLQRLQAVVFSLPSWKTGPKQCSSEQLWSTCLSRLQAVVFMFTVLYTVWSNYCLSSSCKSKRTTEEQHVGLATAVSSSLLHATVEKDQNMKNNCGDLQPLKQ